MHPLSHESLRKTWKKNRNHANARAGGDCVALFKEMSKIIAKQMNGRPASHNPIKKFKNDKDWIKGEESVDAVEMFKNGLKDRQDGDYVISMNDTSGYLTHLKKYTRKKCSHFKLRPGMGIYTAESWNLKNKKKHWGWRHIRMYVGNGLFEDIGYNSGQKLKKVYRYPNQPLFVILAVYDPFSHLRI